MKLGRTLILLWLASIALFAATAIVTLVAPDTLAGVPGLAIRFFLGYCAVIIVAQVWAAMIAIRRLFEELAAKKPVSLRILLR